MDTVIDSSCLIFAAKIPTIFESLRGHYGRIYVPNAVMAEVVLEGRKRGAPEVQTVQRWLDSGALKPAHAKCLASDVLGAGESEALAVAKAKKAVCLTDDRKAHYVGTALGIKVVSLPAFIIFLVRKKKIPHLLAEKWLNQLVENGYYLKTPDYLAVVNAIRLA